MFTTLTPQEAQTRSLICLEKGKKGIATLFRSDDGTLIFGAARLRQPVLRLRIRLDDKPWDEHSFKDLLILRSNFEKSDHWVSLFNLPGENPMDCTPKLTFSSLVTPCTFTCDVIMKAPQLLRREDEAGISKFLTYRMRLHGSEGAAMLVQDDGAAQCTALEISLDRREAEFSRKAGQKEYMKEETTYEDAERAYCISDPSFSRD